SLANVRQLALEAFGTSPDFRFNVPIFLIGLILWVGGFLGMILCFRHWRELSHRARDQAIILLIFVLGSAASVFLSGPGLSHYLVQLCHCFAIFSAFALIHRSTGKRRLVVELGAFLFIVASSTLFVSHEYSLIAQRIKENKGLAYGPEYDIARYLQHEN